MSAPSELCQRLAQAADAAGEAAVLAEWAKLPPPQRAVRYSVRKQGETKVLGADQIPHNSVEGLEVVLHCDDGGKPKEILWRPKAHASLAALMRE